MTQNILRNTDLKTLKTNQFLWNSNKRDSFFSLSLKVWADLERTSTWLSTCRSTKESRLNQTCPVLLTLISLLFKSSVWSRDDLWQSVNTISAPSASANFFPLCGPLRDQTATALTVCTHLVWEGGGWGGRVRFWRLVLIKLILGPFFICQSARMALHVSLSQFICLRSYLPHERPRQPPIRRRMIIVSAFPGKNAGKGKGLAFIPPISVLVKAEKKIEWIRGHRQLETIWLCHYCTSECKPQPQQLHVFHE